MGRVVNTVRIDRPIAEVFAFVTDPTNSPKWDSVVFEASVAERPVRLGTAFHTKGKVLGRVIELDGRVTEFQPYARYTTRSDRPYPYTITWTFQSDDSGTKVVRAGNIETTGLLALLSPITRRIAWRTDQRSLERMKALLETGTR